MGLSFTLFTILKLFNRCVNYLCIDKVIIHCTTHITQLSLRIIAISSILHAIKHLYVGRMKVDWIIH